MYENMDKTSSMLHYLYPLIDKASHKLHNFMIKYDTSYIWLAFMCNEIDCVSGWLNT